MKIAFLTTQTLTGSTVVGRVLPLAREMSKKHEIHILVHEGDQVQAGTLIQFHEVGKDPFIRTASGKKRLKGIALIGRLKLNAFQAAAQLFHIQPDVVIIEKSLPENVLAAWIAKIIFIPRARWILDVDDFELTSNKLSSPLQRAAIHWAQRAGAKIASQIVTVTPFLEDYFRQLAPHTPATLIPTGINLPNNSAAPPKQPTLLYAGSISLASGHRVDLLPAILKQVQKELPDTRLIMAGSGDDITKLKQMFTNGGLTDFVTWKGRYQPEDIRHLLDDSTVVIDPVDGSTTNRAKSSFRVAAAVAGGRPVVTSNIGIRAQLVPKALHDRFFADAANAGAYAEKIVVLLKTPLTQKEQDTLKQHAMRYTWDVLTKQYLILFS